ncbi:MAG: helix-turn-helix transcriptional regulator, partial [Deltaproteobacteria bacterium]|nr:helix-turn-helix transcriptional regulator [Deltaproteobacteria bacterium]
MKIEKRKQILGSALELFAEQGFRGTSTAEIAKHAGVATGTLFHH